MPTFIASNPNAAATYQQTLDTDLEKAREFAKTQWSDVVDLAKQNGISNKWSQVAAEDLVREYPEQFHTLHQEIITGTDRP